MNLVIGVALIFLVKSSIATNYCRKGLCPEGRTHVACGSTGGWNATNCGKNPKLHKLTEADKEFILDLHNQHREEVASGKLPRYTAAKNMKEVTWNDELAHIACFNAKQCLFKHDECRNTDHLPLAGQNLAIVGQTSGYKPFRDAYYDLHNKWYLEHKDCNMNYIRNYQATQVAGKQIGHFTQMVAENVDKVGCCISMYDQRKNKNLFHNVYIVCNYSYISIKNKPIYNEGTPSCKKFSKKYQSLCAN